MQLAEVVSGTDGDAVGVQRVVLPGDGAVVVGEIVVGIVGVRPDVAHDLVLEAGTVGIGGPGVVSVMGSGTMGEAEAGEADWRSRLPR